MSETLLEGYLEKFGALVYNKRWFTLTSDHLTYYKRKPNNSLDKFTSRMLVRDISIVHDEEYDLKMCLSDGQNKFYIITSTREEKNVWTDMLEQLGAKVMGKDDFTDLEYYSELEAALVFPTIPDKKEVEKMKTADSIFLDSISTIVDKGTSFFLPVLIPGGGVLHLAIKGALNGGVKILEFCRKDNLKILEEKLRDDMAKSMLRDTLDELEEDLFAIQQRYENLFNINFSKEQKQMEIPTAMHAFEKIIKRFQIKEEQYLKHSFLLSPYITRIVKLFVGFARLAVLVHPAYFPEICQEANKLIAIMKKYKETVIEIRLAAIVHHDSVARRVASLGKAVFWLPQAVASAIKEAVTDEDETVRFRAPCDKITDEYYPTGSGLTHRWAYPEIDGFEDADEIFVRYKQEIEELYTSYFDETISQLETFKN